MSAPRLLLLPTAAAMLLAGVLAARDAGAQCGASRSSCSTCHDGARAPLPGQAAWHQDHAFADVCPSCHGGRAEASAPEAAHVALVDPLSEASDGCRSCHGEVTTGLLGRYLALRHASTDAASPATAAGGPANPGVRAPREPSTSRPAGSPHGESRENLAMLALIAAVGAGGALFVLDNERARNRRTSRKALASPSRRPRSGPLAS